MNEFDQFVKHDLKVKYYARYTDDFVILANSRLYLEQLVSQIEMFLYYHLGLELHPNKISINPAHRGVDFLGYIIFLHHKILRTRTKKRMFKKLQQRAGEVEQGIRTYESFAQSLNSYIGVLSHANTYEVKNNLKNQFWILESDF